MSHPNIIKTIFYEETHKAEINNKVQVISLIAYELAPYGTLNDLVFNTETTVNEKLARSLFHQLIAGALHLKKNGISHLDIKLDNICIGEGYKLKYIDFDSCYIKGDICVISRGTKNYRAPELKL